MIFNPFDLMNPVRLEAVSLIQSAFSQAGLVDSVLPGRTTPNPDELPASLIFISEPEIKRYAAEEDNKLKGMLTVVCYEQGAKFHPESILDQRGKLIWAALHEAKLASAKDKLLGTSFDYDTDPDTNLVSLTMTFSTTM